MSGARVPVTVVTGFLGSGKTTLLVALLRRPELGRCAVLINEFGEIPLDQAFVGRVAGQVVVMMSGGCLCCAIGGDLVRTLIDLHDDRAEKPFERVLIETSGLADPGPILAQLGAAPLADLFRLDVVVAVVDALQGFRELERQRVSVKQAALADRIVLSKSDIAAPLAVACLKARLDEINSWAPLVAANHGAVSADFLFRPAPAAPARRNPAADHSHAHDHAHGVAAFCLWLDPTPTWPAFAQAYADLTEAHGESILRMKGILDIDGRPVAVHGVQHILHPPESLEDWPDAERRARIVVIADHVPETTVAAFFQSRADRSIHAGSSCRAPSEGRSKTILDARP